MSRARKANQTELNRIMKDINRRMEDFETSVEQLKELKEGVVELEEAIATRESQNTANLEKLERDFVDNKIKAVNRAASELGKVIIPQEELQELRDDLTKIKESGKRELETKLAEEHKKYQEKLEQALNVQKLQHEAETAKLRASAESHQKEVENLNAALDRMTEELKSQKTLTASVVAPRVTPAPKE